MTARKLWPQILLILGGIAMLVGAIDPIEGSLLILPGSGLIALGTFLEQRKGPMLKYRLWAFALIAIGVGAVWGLSLAGGIGGPDGVSPWWAILILPYPIGWSLGIWGPGSPRWILWPGIGVGLWYISLMSNALRTGRYLSANIIIASVGLLTIAGCINRLRKQKAK